MWRMRDLAIIARSRPARIAGWTLAAILALAAAVVVIVVLFGPVTDLIARHDAGAVTGPKRAAALQSARDAARGRLLQLGAGLFAAAALIYTARNFGLSREGQVTDRYTKAVEQLGSDKPLDVRIGGIYALERVARDSARDHPVIMEVLAAFVREHSREQWPPKADNEPRDAPPERSTRPDVQAAVTVIGRRNPRHDRQRINLAAVGLPGADLTGANLAHAYLDDADLTGADLADVNLAGARLQRAYLYRANFHGANLAGAVLTRANLTHAYLDEADLTGADLTNVDITDAYVEYAILARADLALPYDLTRADLTGADLTGASWPSGVAPLRGWQRDDSGGLVRARDAPP
jgi:Pentapeptide repeats (8 copies)